MASNYTLIGSCSQSFHMVLGLLGYRDAWSCFHTKQGDWAISLNDDVPVPDPLPPDVLVLEYGEMTFTFDEILKLCGGLAERIAVAEAKIKQEE